MASQRLETGVFITKKSGRSTWGPEYRITVSFRVPLPFAFAWCTDYTPGDAKLEGDSYERKIVERTPRRVVLEDLYDTKAGWIWSREVVTLQPPNRWHMDGVGNQRDATADYLLTPLPNGRTRLELRWRRHQKTPGAAKLTKAQREATALRAWKRFAAAMEGDYRRARRPYAEKLGEVDKERSIRVRSFTKRYRPP